MKKFRLYIAATLASLCAFSGMLAFAVPASAASTPCADTSSLFGCSKQQACNGANLQDTGGCSATTDQSSKVTSTLRAVLNILSFVVGVVAVIMLIIGGIRFITSQGEGSSTALARNTIIYALVGIIIAVLAQGLVQFVIGRASKPPATPTVQVDSNGCTVPKTLNAKC